MGGAGEEGLPGSSLNSTGALPQVSPEQTLAARTKVGQIVASQISSFVEKTKKLSSWTGKVRQFSSDFSTNLSSLSPS